MPGAPVIPWNSRLRAPYLAQLRRDVLSSSHRYGVPAGILAGIVEQQDAALNPYAVHRDANGSRDLGLTQINTRYFPRQAKAAYGNPAAALNFTAAELAKNRHGRGGLPAAIALYNGAGAPVYQTYADQAAGLRALGLPARLAVATPRAVALAHRRQQAVHDLGHLTPLGWGLGALGAVLILAGMSRL